MFSHRKFYLRESREFGELREQLLNLSRNSLSSPKSRSQARRMETNNFFETTTDDFMQFADGGPRCRRRRFARPGGHC